MIGYKFSISLMADSRSFNVVDALGMESTRQVRPLRRMIMMKGESLL
jgi:hypothetical protein